MPYEIEMDRDGDRGLDRYRITVADGLECDEAYALADWLTVAAQNPTAAFTIDATAVSDPRGGPLAALLARSARLRERVEVVRRGMAARAPLSLPALGGAFGLL
jgi:hypothetical protein